MYQRHLWGTTLGLKFRVVAVIKRGFLAAPAIHHFRHFNADDGISLRERGGAAFSRHGQGGYGLEQSPVERGQPWKDGEQDCLGVEPPVVVVRFVQHERLGLRHPSADKQGAAERLMRVNAARTGGAVPEDTGRIADLGVTAVGQKRFVTTAV